MGWIASGWPSGDSKDNRRSVWQPEFDVEKFGLAVVNGQNPDGTQVELFREKEK